MRSITLRRSASRPARQSPRSNSTRQTIWTKALSTSASSDFHSPLIAMPWTRSRSTAPSQTWGTSSDAAAITAALVISVTRSRGTRKLWRVRRGWSASSPFQRPK